jgi:hypothetical protein
MAFTSPTSHPNPNPASPDRPEPAVNPTSMLTPTPTINELRLTLPPAVVERLERLERRLEKLETFKSPASSTEPTSNRPRSTSRGHE